MRRNCSKQEEVTNAIRSQQWPEAIAAHVADCEICQGVTQAARWMQAMASSPFADAAAPAASSLPDPELVWWKAQLNERQSGMEQGRLLLEILQIGSTVSRQSGLRVGSHGIGMTFKRWLNAFCWIPGHKFRSRPMRLRALRPLS